MDDSTSIIWHPGKSSAAESAGCNGAAGKHVLLSISFRFDSIYREIDSAQSKAKPAAILSLSTMRHIKVMEAYFSTVIDLRPSLVILKSPEEVPVFCFSPNHSGADYETCY